VNKLVVLGVIGPPPFVVLYPPDATHDFVETDLREHRSV
jgi:hypothetical protein